MFKITKLKTWLTACCFLLAVITQAQKGNPYWAVPPNYWPAPGTPVALPTNTYSIGGVNTAYQGTTMLDVNPGGYIYGPNNMYKDASGNLLFSIVSGYVFSKNGYLIDTLISDTMTMYTGGHSPITGVRAVIQGYSEACVVPNPSNCSQYYVFTSLPINTNTQGYGGGGAYPPNNCGVNKYNFVKPFYTCIDISQRGPYMPSTELGKNLKTGATGQATAGDLYKVTSTPDLAGGCHPYSGDIHYASTKVYNKGGVSTPPYRLLFVMNNDELITYKVTGTGSYGVSWVSTNVLSSATSNSIGNQQSYVNLTELEVFEDSINHKIKVAFGAPNAAGAFYSNNSLVLMDYDTTGNYSSSYHLAYTSAINSVGLSLYGIEFSPDGNYVFVSHNKTPDYPNSTVDRITYSTTATYTLSSDTALSASQIEKGTDNNLYLVGTTTTTASLAKISSPNSATPTLTTNTQHLSSYSRGGGGGLYNIGYLLPDQIDQEIYSNLFNHISLQCCLLTNPYDQQIYDAGWTTTTWTTTATTQTWSANTGTTTATCKNPLAVPTNTTSTVTIGQELRIPAGYVVTINNMTIKFSPQARLIIENGTSTKNGGKLILSGCTLTVDTRCETDMWPGVQVWGSYSLSQTAGSQGWLVLSNNTVIENAYLGVLAGCDTTTWLSAITPPPVAPLKPQAGHYSFGPASKYGGGAIITSTSSTFLNNQRDLVYNDYNAGASGFQKLTTTTFKATKLLVSSVHQRYFMGMFNHTGTFTMSGCIFVDTTLNGFTDTALYTLNSAYYVDENSSTQRSTFTNFRYGIYSANTGGNAATISCKNSTFNDNLYGIYLGYVNNPIVETDTFRIYSTTCFLHCSNPSTYGLYLDNGTGYSVRDNYFTKYGSGFTNLIYGTIANNTQNTDIIYRNTFKSVNYGNQAQFQNYIYNGAFPYNDNGLQYYCNTFVDSTISNADIFVPGTLSGSNIGTGTTTYSAGIGFNQGYGNSGTPANGGNHFSHTPSGVDYYIDTVVNRTYNSVYLYNCGGSCTGSPYIPRTYRNLSPSATTYTYNCALNIYTCPGCRTTDPNQALLSQADSYLQTYNSLQTQIDGGNTSNLLSFVNNNGNAQAVYNSLNAAAPYISDEVLEAYINGNYPSSDIAQILTACSPLTDNVNNIVKASALSSAIKTQINSSQTGKSKMGQLKTEMSAAFTSRHLILDEVIRAYINDTIPANVKKGYAIMKVKALELPAKNQVQVGIDIHDSAMAANALNQVQNAEGQSNYVKLHTILLQNLSVPAEQLMQNASVLNDVLAMATDSSDRFTYYKANALLQTVGKSNYVPYVQPANTPSNTPNGANQRTTTSIETPVLSQSTLINQPNPFKESTTVKVNVVEKSENAYIVVSDMVGNEVARYQVQQGENNITINAGSLNQSVMFCTLVIDGKRIKTNKMVLIK